MRRAAGYRGIVIAILSSLATRAVSAQATVAGQLSIVERPGTKTTDLADAVVWLDGPGAPPATGGTRTQIVMRSREYVPRVRIVPTGSSVAFPNHDPFRHNVFSKSGPGEFDLGLYGRGESREARVERPGVYPVFCNIHAKMLAFIVAVPTSYVAQPNPDGRFSIAGVPAGTYTLHVWHDRGGTTTRDITVTTDSQPAVNVQLDARGYRFVQHRNKFGQEYTNAGRDRY